MYKMLLNAIEWHKNGTKCYKKDPGCLVPVVWGASLWALAFDLAADEASTKGSRILAVFYISLHISI